MNNFAERSTAPLALVFILLLLSGCAHHPVDCAIGFPWDSCLPGTAGYVNNGGEQRDKENAAKEQLNAKPAAPEHPKDVYAELIKLDDLRKKGIISDAEYEVQKKKVLDGK